MRLINQLLAVTTKLLIRCKAVSHTEDTGTHRRINICTHFTISYSNRVEQRVEGRMFSTITSLLICTVCQYEHERRKKKFSLTVPPSIHHILCPNVTAVHPSCPTSSLISPVLSIDLGFCCRAGLIAARFVSTNLFSNLASICHHFSFFHH